MLVTSNKPLSYIMYSFMCKLDQDFVSIMQNIQFYSQVIYQFTDTYTICRQSTKKITHYFIRKCNATLNFNLIVLSDIQIDINISINVCINIIYSINLLLYKCSKLKLSNIKILHSLTISMLPRSCKEMTILTSDQVNFAHIAIDEHIGFR